MASVRMVHRGVQKVVCVGKNYAAHAAEMGTQAKELPKQPSLFLKPPSSIVHPPGPIQIPQGVEAHYEGKCNVEGSLQGPPPALWIREYGCLTRVLQLKWAW